MIKGNAQVMSISFFVTTSKEFKLKKAILSIRPEYVREILNTNKQYEYRKKAFSKEVHCILIYETSPIKMVVAEAEIRSTIIGSPKEVWSITKDFSGISESAFFEYYNGCNIAVAYALGNVHKFEKPKALEEYGIHRAPQSFIYING